MKFLKEYLKKRQMKGMAFLTTVILLGIMVLVCAGLSVMVFRDAFTIKKMRYATQAYFLAEAGAEEAITSLYDSGFDTSGYPITDRALGAGTYSVSLSNHPTESDLVLLNCTGSVRGVSSTIKVIVRNNSIEAFDYPVLGGGRMYIAGGIPLIGLVTEIYGGNVRSNNANSNWAVQVGGLLTRGYVDEDVLACGRVKLSWLGTINGDIHSPLSPSNNGTLNGVWIQEDVSAVPMPPFDASFFDFYEDLALNGGMHYSGSQLFSSGTYSPGNGVIFVNGVATVAGNVTINGCLIATGQIRINPGFENNVFILNQVGTLPALMTSGGNIGIHCQAQIEGLIYSSNRVTTFDLPFAQIDIDGAVIGKGGIYFYAPTRIDFIKQNPPGIAGADAPLQVECWSG